MKPSLTLPSVLAHSHLPCRGGFFSGGSVKEGQEGETSCPVGDLVGFRKLLKMIYILLEKGQYYDPNYAVKATE